MLCLARVFKRRESQICPLPWFESESCGFEVRLKDHCEEFFGQCFPSSLVDELAFSSIPVSRLPCTFRIWQQTSAPTIIPFFHGVLWKYSRLPWCVKKNVCSLLGRKITLKFLFSSSKENSLKIPGYGFLGSVKKSSSNWKKSKSEHHRNLHLASSSDYH